jgi:hypothetical protein
LHLSLQKGYIPPFVFHRVFALSEVTDSIATCGFLIADSCPLVSYYVLRLYTIVNLHVNLVTRPISFAVIARAFASV